jgi:hypothetical protein
MFELIRRKQDNDPAKFWQDYEERYGEKVLSYALGRYITGWNEYDGPFWGLLIATGGGFRIHHFPHEGWLQALSRATSGGEPPKEKTIFIPRDRILQVEFRVEKSWWRRALFAHPPLLVIRYRDAEGADLNPAGGGTELIAETEHRAKEIVQHLAGMIGEGGAKV